MQVKSILLVTLLLASSAAAASKSGPAIVKAAREGNAKKAASLVASVSPDEAASALSEAAQLGHLNVVEALVAKGVDVNGEKQSGPTERPYIGLLDLVNFKARSGGTIVEGQGVFFKRDVAAPEHEHIPLIVAASTGRLDIVKWLSEHGAALELQESAVVLKDLQQANGVAVFKLVRVMGVGNNALSAAVIAAQTAVVQFLMEHGADISRHVVVRSAGIPGIVAFAPGRRDPNVDSKGIVFAHTGEYLSQSTDGVISTNTAIEPARELSIRELMASSTVLEIKALVASR